MVQQDSFCSSFAANFRFHLHSKHSAVRHSGHCLLVFLKMRYNRTFSIPKENQHDFLGGGLYAFLLYYRRQMSPLHAFFLAF